MIADLSTDGGVSSKIILNLNLLSAMNDPWQESKGAESHGGDRTPVSTRLPTEQYAVYHREAERLGIPFGSYVAMVLAAAHKLETPDYVVLELKRAEALRGQEELPMARAG